VAATVSRVKQTDDGFAVETEDEERYRSEYVIAATKNATDHLTGIEGVGIINRGKAFVDTNERGRTGVDRLNRASVPGLDSESIHTVSNSENDIYV